MASQDKKQQNQQGMNAGDQARRVRREQAREAENCAAANARTVAEAGA